MNPPASLRHRAANSCAGKYWCPPHGGKTISLVIAMAVLMTANACTHGSPVDTAAAVARAEGGDGADARRRAAAVSTAARLKAARLQRERASKAAAAARKVAIANARATYTTAIAQCDAVGEHVRDACRRQASDDFARAKANADAVRAVDDPTA